MLRRRLAVALLRRWLAVALLRRWLAVALLRRWLAITLLRRWLAVALLWSTVLGLRRGLPVARLRGAVSSWCRAGRERAASAILAAVAALGLRRRGAIAHQSRGRGACRAGRGTVRRLAVAAGWRAILRLTVLGLLTVTVRP